MAGDSMTNASDRWVLAFDGSCRFCRAMSRAVAEACDGTLEVLPLAQPDVRRWREQALGADPAWAPTLIRVRPDGTRAWVGPRLGVKLARHLGVRSTLAVLGAMGRTRRPAQRNQLGVRSLVGGLAVAAALVKLGPSGGKGKGKGEDPVAWAESNKDRLPQAYSEFAEHSLPYRKAIFTASSAAVRSRLWTEHLRQYGATHDSLSESQERALQRAAEVLGNESLHSRPSPPDLNQVLEDLRAVVTAAFAGEAQSIIATLGPSEPEAASDDCQCSMESDYCWQGCVYSDECHRVGGCGTGWLYVCDGWCDGP